MSTIYGKLSVLPSPNGLSNEQALCECQCGKTVTVNKADLQAGRKTDCGCVYKPICADNPRQGVFIYKGKELTLGEIEAKYGVSKQTFRYRVKHGLTVAEAIEVKNRLAPKVLYNGEYHHLIDLAAQHGIKYRTVMSRLNNGWTVYQALNTPVKAPTMIIESKPASKAISYYHQVLNIPAEAKYVAADADGDIHAFKVYPELSTRIADRWLTPGHAKVKVGTVKEWGGSVWTDTREAISDCTPEGWLKYTGLEDIPLNVPLLIDVEDLGPYGQRRVVVGCTKMMQGVKMGFFGPKFHYAWDKIYSYRIIADLLLPEQSAF